MGRWEQYEMKQQSKSQHGNIFALHTCIEMSADIQNQKA